MQKLEEKDNLDDLKTYFDKVAVITTTIKLLHLR